jgi:hypothetical protein
MFYEKTFSVCLCVRDRNISRPSWSKVTKFGIRDLWDITEAKFEDEHAMTFLTFFFNF